MIATLPILAASRELATAIAASGVSLHDDDAPLPPSPSCPECGTILFRASACITCPGCGWGRCG